MNKFDRILSDSELLDVYRSLDNPKLDRDSVIEAMGAAVDAAMGKLAEQEPVAWYVDNDVTFDQKIAETWKKNLFIVKPLYANPCVSRASDKPSCVSESAESDTQHHLSYLKRYQKWRRDEATPSRASVELLERILKDGY